MDDTQILEWKINTQREALEIIDTKFMKMVEERLNENSKEKESDAGKESS